ncbi:MAG: peptide ABC transporter substrate-binding protein [Candidatus Velthaea sp.]
MSDRAARARAAALACGLTLAACTRVGGEADGRHAWTQPGHVRIGATDEPDSLNLLFAHDAAADQIGTLLFAYVFRFNPKGELLPEIAREIPTYANGGISKDNKTITLHLRPGMTWADGAPLDARDIRFTWRAVMNSRNNTKLRLGWDDVASMDVPDNDTLVVRLKQPNSAMLYNIFGGGGGAAYPPLPEHVLGKLPDINRAAFNIAPLSSGPWILKSWTHGAALEFAPNPRYWRGAPRLKALTWKVVPNADTLFQEIQTHAVDLYDPVPESQIGQLKSLPGVAVVKRLKSNWRHLEINTRKPILADVRVRRAIAQAVDWDRMNATIYHGVNIRATSDIVPDSWAAPRIAPWRFDPAAAQRLLAAAGWLPGPRGIRFKNGTPLAITISTGTNKPANIAAEVQMQQQLRAAGIELTIKNYPVSLLFAQNGPLYGGSYDMSWSVDTNGPEPDNQGNWSGDFIPPHGANTSFLQDPVITQTSAQALLTFDRRKRKALYQREEERIHELVPAVFLYWSVDTAAVNSDLKNYRPAEYDMADLWNSYEWEI